MSAFKNIRVLDLSRVLAGPYSTMMLADFGADTIKIESPGLGDDSRGFGPFVGEGIKKESAYFMSLNRNKRSIVLDFKIPEHIAVFREMVKTADVVVENYRPGTMEKFGLGYEDLKQINPGIIYAACSGFGHSGPLMYKPAYDIIVQAMGGIMSITGEENGEPTRVGASVGDVVAGIFTAFGVSAALFAREQTGKGQKVDVAMLDCQIAILENAIGRYVVSGEVPGPLGNRHPSITPFAAFTAADGKIIVGAGNNGLWSRLCKLFNREDLITDKRFSSNESRTTNVEILTAIMNGILVTRPVADWLADLDEAGIPCSPINTIAQVLQEPQIKERDMIVEVGHPVAGKLKMPGVPVKLSDTPGSVRTPAPTLGQHSVEILQEVLGWDVERASAFFNNNG